MTGKNIISPVVEAIDSVNGKEISRTKVVWKTQNNKILRQNLQSSFQGKSLTNDVSFDSYDNFDNPVQVTYRDGKTKTLQWDSKKPFLIKEIVGVNMTDSFVWNPIAGVTKHILPAGTSINYDYNNFRLSKIKYGDKIAEEYTYHYVPHNVQASYNKYLYFDTPVSQMSDTSASDSVEIMVTSNYYTGINVAFFRDGTLVKQVTKGAIIKMPVGKYFVISQVVNNSYTEFPSHFYVRSQRDNCAVQCVEEVFVDNGEEVVFETGTEYWIIFDTVAAWWWGYWNCNSCF
jgi:hypothetical protein